MGQSAPALWLGGKAFAKGQAITGITAQKQDQLVLANSLSYEVLLKAGDSLPGSVVPFGSDNDFIGIAGFQAGAKPSLTMWVNHENVHPGFWFENLGKTSDKGKYTAQQFQSLRQAVGGSLLNLEQIAGKWSLRPQAKQLRIHGESAIPFAYGANIGGKSTCMGTLANCAGGTTPWGTFLSGEENFQDFYGDYLRGPNGKWQLNTADAYHQWQLHDAQDPYQYGWIVEIHPETGEAQKHLNLGRFRHEGATTSVAKDGRVVVYMGEDRDQGCIFKFVSEASDSFAKGTLYVANLGLRQWLPVDWQKNDQLKSRYRNQEDVLLHAAEAAIYAGGTPLERPEDIAIQPSSGDVFIAMTNSPSKGNLYGYILKIREAGGDAGALTFTHDVFLTGGKSGIACPDNLKFDPHGHLWVTTDMSEKVMNRGAYEPFQNNGLFLIPMHGSQAGHPIQVASAPTDAELTGPCFTPDGLTLFLSVQHPGLSSALPDKLSSHWPTGKLPKSSVVAIQGAGLQALSKG